MVCSSIFRGVGGHVDPLGCGLGLIPSSGGGQHQQHLVQNYKLTPSPASGSPHSTASSTRSHLQTSTSTWSSTSSGSMGPPVGASNGGGSSGTSHQGGGEASMSSFERGTAYKIHLNTSYRHMKYGDGIDVKVTHPTPQWATLFQMIFSGASNMCSTLNFSAPIFNCAYFRASFVGVIKFVYIF